MEMALGHKVLIANPSGVHYRDACQQFAYYMWPADLIDLVYRHIMLTQRC